jgi:light-regulated signal transduction histidine kinase (bacteriophytochrome)
MHYLQLIRNNTHNMGQLIDDLLAFSRLGRQPVQRNHVDIEKLVRNVIEQMTPELQDRKIDFVIKKLPECFADEKLLNQVIFQFDLKRIKFTRSKSQSVIEVGFKEAVPHLPDGTIEQVTGCYYVSDNGVGFDMRYYDKLFNVFQRFHKVEDFEGTGVGLAIVKRVINKHNGMVWADSTPGLGSTFYFTIGKEDNTNDQSS